MLSLRPRFAYASLKSAAGAVAISLALAAPAAQAIELALDPSIEVPAEQQPAVESQTGTASYYSRRFEGRRTASGDTFRNAEMLAAHSSHPFGTIVRVTNLDKGTSVVVRIADRFGRAGSRIIDLSQAAASRIGIIARGHAKVLVEVLEWPDGTRKTRSGGD